MATMNLISQLTSQRLDTKPNATWSMSLVALALALLIGFGAVQVQQQPTTGADLTQHSEQGGTKLDGRGKWAGYM